MEIPLEYPTQRPKSLVIDSVHEWARLTFSFDMKKHAAIADKNGLTEQIRQINNYPGATERLNMVVRRFKDYRDKQNMDVIMLVHEQIEKIYARGGMISGKGKAPSEPIGVMGWPNIPGSTAPTEIMGVCDNVFRIRPVNGTPAWICKPEPLGDGTAGDNWTAKDRFGGTILNPAGILPASYVELKSKIDAHPQLFWGGPYIWMIYGVPGVGKTRSLLTFPRPMHIFDIDHGCKVLLDKNGKLPDGITVTQYNSEESDDYPKFISDLERIAA
jgi:hypothetical protein